MVDELAQLPTRSVVAQPRRYNLYDQLLGNRFNEEDVGIALTIFGITNLAFAPVWHLLGPLGLVPAFLLGVSSFCIGLDCYNHNNSNWMFGIPVRHARKRVTKQLNKREGWRPRKGAVHPRQWIKRDYRTDDQYLAEVTPRHLAWDIKIVHYFLVKDTWRQKIINQQTVQVNEGEEVLAKTVERMQAEADEHNNPPNEVLEAAAQEQALHEHVHELAAVYTQ